MSEPGKVDAKLGADVFKLDQEPHIVIDVEKCRTVCTQRACLQVCPADLYELNDEGDMTVNWEGCLECGTCLICCDEKALTLAVPAGRLRRAVPDELTEAGVDLDRQATANAARRRRRAERRSSRTPSVPDGVTSRGHRRVCEDQSRPAARARQGSRAGARGGALQGGRPRKERPRGGPAAARRRRRRPHRGRRRGPGRPQDPRDHEGGPRHRRRRGRHRLRPGARRRRPGRRGPRPRARAREVGTVRPGAVRRGLDRRLLGPGALAGRRAARPARDRLRALSSRPPAPGCAPSAAWASRSRRSRRRCRRRRPW